MKNDMPEEIFVVIDPRDGCTIWRDNNNGTKYIRADLTEPSPQPPTDNDHVAEGCEQFTEPVAKPLAVLIKELEAEGYKPALDKAREEVKRLFKPVIDDGLRDAALRDLYAIINGSTDVKHDCHVYIKKHGDTIYKSLKSREKPVEVKVEKIIDECQLWGSYDNIVSRGILNAVKKKYPAGIKIVDGGA